MASKEAMQRLRVEAHRWFDPLWEGEAQRQGVARNKARKAAYRWLRRQLNLAPHQCHFSRMTAAQMRQAIALCKQFYKTNEQTTQR